MQVPDRRPQASWRFWLALALCASAAGAAGCASIARHLPGTRGSVEGSVRFTGAPDAAPALGPAVVYLEREGQTAEIGPSGGEAVLVSDTAGQASPHELLVVSRGQPVRFASESGLEHRLFSVWGQQRVEVEVPPHGSSRPVAMQRAGWTPFYCALHQDEAWEVFVAPSSHFARTDAQGTYRITGVPPGAYTLSIWSFGAQGPVRSIRVGVRARTLETIWLDPARVDAP